MDQSVQELLAAADEALAEAGFRTGDFGAARDLAEQAQARASQTGDAIGHAQALNCLGMIAHYENITRLMSGSKPSSADVDSEEKLFRQALLRWQEVTGQPGAAQPDSAQAADARQDDTGQDDAAPTSSAQAGSTQAGSAQALFGLGLVFQVLHSDWMTAMPYFWQALDLVSKPDAAAGAYLRSEVHRHVGFYFLVEDVQPPQAVRHLQLSLDYREELGDPRRIPSGLQALGQAELSAGNRDRAIDLLTRAVAEARSAGLAQERIEAAERDLHEASGAPEAGAPAAENTSSPADPGSASADASTSADAGGDIQG